jgi:hypothetical protein
LFCASTLERSYMLVASFAGKPVDESHRDDDRKVAGDFTLAALWAQMNLDLIACAMYHHRALKPTRSVLGGIVTGMRTAVLAYANARKGYELRVKNADSTRQVEAGQWDTEDEALLHASSSFHSAMEAQS